MCVEFRHGHMGELLGKCVSEPFSPFRLKEVKNRLISDHSEWKRHGKIGDRFFCVAFLLTAMSTLLGMMQRCWSIHPSARSTFASIAE